MEKCTFCIQRILHAEHRAKVEGRPVRDGEVQPACVQSCPTRTYVFGDLHDAGLAGQQALQPSAAIPAAQGTQHQARRDLPQTNQAG